MNNTTISVNLIPGVRLRGSGHNTWLDRAEEWIELNVKNARAIALRYFCFAVFRRIGQQRRAVVLARRVREQVRAGYQPILVGHSNGADIICRALELLRVGKFKVRAVYLIAGACEEDFNKNGLNRALLDDIVETVHVYYSKNDDVLNYWARTSRLFQCFGVGYGLIGLTGPKNVKSCFAERVFRHQNNRQGHTSWLQGVKLVEILQEIVSNET